MATNASDDFGKSLARLEEIVSKLEQGNLSLDESVTLFKEGKALAQRCEHLLKQAQSAIDAATREGGRPEAASGDGLFGQVGDDAEELSL